jgi:integrase
MKMLADLITQSLMEKLGDQDSQTFLRGLFGRAAQRRKRGLSISRLIDQYLEHCHTYYRHPDGTPTFETDNTRHALGPLRKMYGRTRAEEFRPLKFKAVRDEMVKRGWCRKTINAQIGRIKRMFKWGVENELIPADRYHALQAVPGLKLGRAAARESQPVKPVPEALVEATLPHVSSQVAAMIRLQLLTGMRPGEVIIMRTCDVERAGEIWVYRPSHHKTAHHAHERLVFLGPQARQVVAHS